jgi:hypothetical protein
MRRGAMRRVMLHSPRLIKKAGGIGVGGIAGQRPSKVGALGLGASSSSRHRLKTAGVGRMRRGQTPTSGAAGAGGLTKPQASERIRWSNPTQKAIEERCFCGD